MRRGPRSATVTLRIGNRIAEMKKVVEAVDEFGASHGLARTVVHALNVSLDEILNNTISYGYVDDKRHEIVVRLSLVRGELVAEVHDDGVAFNPLEAPSPKLSGGLYERGLGGLGVHFVRSLMDNVEYVREDGLNRLRLRKRFASAALSRSGLKGNRNAPD
jgi:anti-sigma regulatory factor (Ser/Thr protein kinase)